MSALKLALLAFVAVQVASAIPTDRVPAHTVTVGSEFLREFALMTPVNASTHYGDPASGCMSDEIAIQIQGVSGDVCAPKCSLIKSCPTDLPDGVTAAPQCALEDSSTGNKYCALICTPSANDQCGPATCKAIQGVGICTYDD